MASSSRLGYFPNFYALEIELLADESTSLLDLRVLRFVARLFANGECFDTELNPKLYSVLSRSDHKLGTHYSENGAYAAIGKVLSKNWIAYAEKVHEDS